MRVLATWDPHVLPSPFEARPIEDEAALGLIPGVDASEWFVGAWDPSGAATDDEDLHEYIRETVRGVEVCRHPEAILRDTPRLWDVVSMWRSGVSHDLSRADYAELTNFEIECWLVLRAAHQREEIRRIRQRQEETAN